MITVDDGGGGGKNCQNIDYVICERPLPIPTLISSYGLAVSPLYNLHTIRKSSTSACPMCGDEEKLSHTSQDSVQIKGQYFQDYCLSVNDIFDNQHITNIVNFANRTKRLIVPEELDQSGMTYIITHALSRFTLLFQTQLALKRTILIHVNFDTIHSDCSQPLFKKRKKRPLIE